MKLPALRTALLAHYDAYARDLPWRATSDPYAIWISEVMSQQTRVETVIPYWEAWLERFPTVEALADAEQDEVLKSWEGLGYYSRARNLHAGAAVVRERFGGELPGASSDLLAIPGIGPYTAGAIASIAFGEAVPAIDGNVRRVFARLFDIPDPTPARLRELGQALVDPDRPGDFNQSVMELGATICTPRSPRCEICPVQSHCGAFQAGTVNERPLRKKKPATPRGIFLTTILMRGDSSSKAEVLLVKRGPGLLQGLWSFPEVRVDGEEWRESDGHDSARTLAASCGMTESEAPTYLGGVEHVFSHLRATYQVTLLPVYCDSHVETGDAESAPQWMALTGLDALALPTGQKRIVELLLRHLGG